MPPRLRCLLHRAVDQFGDPWNAAREAGRRSVRES